MNIRMLSVLAVVVLWLLTGCVPGPQPQIAEPEVTETVAESAVTMPPTTEPAPEMTEPAPAATEGRWDVPSLTQEMMVFTVEGMEEEVPVFCWDFGTYRVCIPSEDWSFAMEESCERWTSDFNDQVSFSVYHLGGLSREEIAPVFAADSGYRFEDLMGGSSAQDYLIGSKGSACCAFFVAGDGTVVAWEYPLEAAEGFGSRMAQMAATFAIVKG